MKVTKIILVLLTSIIYSLSVCKAQSINKTDTLYYLYNPDRVPENDRMITVDVGTPHVFYTINCRCLKDNTMPVFLCNSTIAKSVDGSFFRSTKFTKLVDLIEVVRQNDTPRFIQKYTIFFVMPSKKGYLIYPAHFLGGGLNKMF